mgnify:CR=1 FL=1
MVTRGVLFDMTKVLGIEYLKAGQTFSVTDLQEAEKKQGVKVQKGDVIIIISYCLVPFEKAKEYSPILLFPNEKTNLLQ